MRLSRLVAGAAAAGVAATLVGATPAAAVTDLVTVVAYDTRTGPEAAFKAANAVCPAGTLLLGGGAGIVGGGNQVRLTSMLPSPKGLPKHSYYATASDYGVHSGDWTLYTWATCGSGVTGWQVVTASADLPPGSTLSSVRATCPTGKKVIGTGGVARGKYPNQLDTVAPSAALDSVLVEAALAESDGPPSSQYGARAYAVCVDPVPGLQLATRSSGFTSEDKTVAVKCPPGTRLHGAGGSLTGAPGQAHLGRIGNTGAAGLTGVAVTGYEDDTGHPGTWDATAYAICAG